MNYKHSISYLALLILCASFALAGTSISISPPLSEVSYNNQIKVSVNISTTDSVYGAQFKLHFNPEQFQAISIGNGGFLSQDGDSLFEGENKINNTLGIVSYGVIRATNLNGVSGSGALANVTFKALTQNNLSKITIEDVVISDPLGVSYSLSSISNGSIQTKTVHAVVISEIMKNPQAVVDLDGEYVELYNPNNFSVNINGWTIKDNDADSHSITSGSSLVILPYDYFVLCRNDNSLANGNVSCDYEYTGFILDDITDEVILLNEGSHEVDRVEYTNAFPTTSGKSMELATLNLDNNIASNWRDATLPLSSGDKGSPGMDNLVLSGPAIANLQKTPEPGNEDQDVTLSATITDFVPITNVSVFADFEGVNKTYPVAQVIGSVYTFIIDDSFLENKETVSYQWFAEDSEGYSSIVSKQSFTIINRAPILVSNIAPITLAEDSIKFVNVSSHFEDLDGDSLVFLSVDSENLFIEPQNWSGLHLIIPEDDFNGSEVVVFKVVDQYGLNASSNPITITVTPINDAPIFTNLPVNMNTTEETPMTFSVSAFDIDNDNLTFYVNDPAFLVNGNSITYTPEANFYGIKPFMVTVSDGQINVTDNSFIDVLPSNDAPVISAIPAQNAIEETNLSLVLTPYFSDADTDISLLEVSESGQYASIIGQTITFNYPNGITNDVVSISVSDGIATAKTNISVSIQNTNDAPKLTDIAAKNVVENSMVTIQLNATDEDPLDSVSYNTTASFGSLNSASGLFSWVPNESNIGTNILEFSAIDSQGAISKKNATIQVSSMLLISDVDVVVDGNTTNNVAPNGIVSAKPGSNLTLTVTLENKASANLFGIDALATLHTSPVQQDSENINQLNGLSSQTRSFSITIPTIIEEGSYQLDLYASGVTQLNEPKNAMQSIFINVNKDVHKIVIDSASFVPNNLQCIRDGNLTLVVTNVGQFNETVSIHAKQSALGIDTLKNFNLTKNEQTLLSIPVSAPNTSRGNYLLDINATYFFGTQSTLSKASITIANCAPEMAPIAPLNGKELSQLNFQISASDFDFGETLTFSSNRSDVLIVKNPNGTSAQVSWTPQNKDIFIQHIIFSVSDGASTDSTMATVEVENINDAPMINSFNPLSDPIILDNIGTQQQFSVSAADPDFDLLTYRWTRNGTIVGSNTNSYTHDANGVPGIFDIKVNVSDVKGLSATRSWKLTVTDKPMSSPGLLEYSGPAESATSVKIHNQHGEIDFGSQIIDLGSIANLDPMVKLESGVAGLDVNAAPQLNRPASIKLFGLAFSLTPPLYENNNFQVSGTSPCTVCTTQEYSGSTLSFNSSLMRTFFVPVANRNPSITSSPRGTANINEQYFYDVEYSDADNDPVSFSLTSFPSGMTINAASGLISWIPTNFSSEQVSIKIVDNKGGQATQSFTLRVIEPPKLIISDLDAKVDKESDKNLADGETISDEARPGSKVQFIIEVENLFDEDTQDIDIENVNVQVTIFDVDDGDDLEEEVDEFDLKAGDHESVNVEFTIPYEVDDDTFDVLIEVDGSDENDKEHRAEARLQLEVEKEKHEISIIEASALPSALVCDRSVTLRAEIVNTGREDEDDVSLEIESEELGIKEVVEGIELDEGGSNNRYSKTFGKTLSADVAPGEYQIAFTASYDGTRTDSTTVNILVGECVQQSTIIEQPKTATESVGEAVNVVRPQTIVESKPVALEPQTGQWIGWDNYTLLMIILLIIFVGLVIFIVGAAIILLTR